MKVLLGNPTSTIVKFAKEAGAILDNPPASWYNKSVEEIVDMEIMELKEAIANNKCDSVIYHELIHCIAAYMNMGCERATQNQIAGPAV